jgi:hypothetical protein
MYAAGWVIAAQFAANALPIIRMMEAAVSLA